MIQTSVETNGKKLSAVYMYLLDSVYKSRQEEIEKYLKNDDPEKEAEVHEEAEIYVDPEVHEEAEELNRNYSG